MRKARAFPTAALALAMCACLVGCPPEPPVAGFTASQRVGPAPLVVTFTDTSSTDGQSVTARQWDFGDGSTGDKKTPTKTYFAPGAYTVSLTVTTKGGTDTETQFRYIVADGPTEETIMLPGDVPLTLVWVPAGNFMMGAPDAEAGSIAAEKPRHSVTLTQGFWVGKYEITKAQWEAVMGSQPWNGYAPVLADPDSSAVNISWNAAQAFAEELSDVTGDTFRLPWEAEWEYACRAGATERYYWGEDPSLTLIGDYAWWAGNAQNAGEAFAHVVGTKLPNAWGIHDMSGNAWEWVADWYGPYASEDISDPTGPGSGSTKVVRGGGWYNPSATTCRSAFRGGMDPTGVYADYGFRVCRTAAP